MRLSSVFFLIECIFFLGYNCLMSITELITEKQKIDNLREDIPKENNMMRELMFSDKEVTEQGLLVVPPAFDLKNGK